MADKFVWVSPLYGSTGAYKAIKLIKENEEEIKKILPKDPDPEVTFTDNKQVIIFTSNQSALAKVGDYLIQKNQSNYVIADEAQFLSGFKGIVTEVTESTRTVHAPRAGGSVQSALEEARKVNPEAGKVKEAQGSSGPSSQGSQPKSGGKAGTPPGSPQQ